MTDISDGLLAGIRAAPKLDPSMVYGVAAATPTDQVPDTATATEAFGDITKRVNYLNSVSPAIQASAWASAGPDEQKMLTAAGYTPPTLHKGSSGPFAAVGHFLGTVAEDTLVKPGEALAHGVGDVLHDLGAPLRALQHAYRAAALITDTERLQGHGGFSGQTLAATFNPSEWAKMWRASENGEQTFSPVSLQKLAGKYDPDTLDLAKQIAGGTKVDDIIARTPPADQQALVARINSDKDLQQAIEDLNAAKLSVGRRIIGDNLQEKLQVTLPKSLPLVGGARVNPVSGGIDAVADWFGDPLVVGAKLGKGAEIAKYLVQGPDDVERLSKLPQVDRALKDVTATLNTPHAAEGLNAAALINRWPKLAPVAEMLAKENVDTPEKLTEWFKGETGMSALLSGRAGGALKDGVLMPHLSVVDQAALGAKGGLRTAINWAVDPARVARQVGDEQTVNALDQARQTATGFLSRKVEAVKQLTTLTAKGTAFDPSSPEAITMIQRLGSYVLPSTRVDDLVNAWAAAPDLATKRDIYKGLLGEVFDAAGVTRTAEGRNWASQFTSVLDEALTKPVYSGSGADTVIRDGVDARRALDMPQMSTEWALPGFKDLTKEATRTGFLNRLYQGTVNSDGVDAFMTNVWKPTMLLRLGFPIRAGGEELVGAIMREGPLGLLRGRLAAGAAEGELAARTEEGDRLLPFHPLSRVWNHYADALPEQIRTAIETPADFVGAVIGDRTRRAFRAVEGKLAGQTYMDAARELWRAGPLESAFTSEVAAMESRAAGYLDDVPSVVKATKLGDSPRPAYFREEGPFRNIAPTESGYVNQWKKGLDELGQGPLFRAALEGVGGEREAQVQRVMDVIESPGYAKAKAFADRSLYTTDGRLVGTTATVDEATRDWANAVVDHVNSLTHTEQGVPIEGLAQRVLADRVGPPVAELAQTPPDMLPGPVKGRDMIPVSRNWVRDLMDRGFQQVVGRPMDWMVRQPLFIHNYATSLDEAQGLRALFTDSAAADEHIRQVAVERAINKTVPFIHDPQMRSQFAVQTRNLAPFWFAQEQFYKRWANIAMHSPEAFRQAQLVMMGLRHSGVLHTDDQGNDYFLYPGASVVQSAITKGLDLIPGQRGKWKLPLPVGFSGQVRFATPGLERLGVPSFGPLVGIPMHAMSQMFPELAPVEQGVLGDRGAGRAYWEQVTPTTVSRLIHIAVDSPNTSPQMASAMMQAITYLEATGNAPANNASPQELQGFQEKVKNWTRILFLTRTLYGFSAPASPELQMDPDQLSKEYRDLLNQLPIEEATAEFMRRHPDATPYTVFQSKSASGATLPATTQAAEFMANNEAFLSTYPQAGGWFIPQSSSDTKFSLPAYREQLALQMRQQKSPVQFYNDLKYSEAADTYFKNRDRKDVMLEGVNGPTATKLRTSDPALLQQIISEGAGAKAAGTRAQAINTSWASWKDDFLATHPVFAQELSSPDAQNRRAETVAQLHQALADPRLPDTPQNDAIRSLVGAFDQVSTVITRLKGQTSTAAANQRKAVKTAFGTWAEKFVADHPDAAGLYNKVFRPEVEAA